MLVIANPATRRDPTRLIGAIQASAPPGVELDIRLTRWPGEAVVLARDAGSIADLVVAVGGDGTVADVATGIRGTGIPLGIVPGGSTNITARELGIPPDARSAADLIFGRHRLAAIDVGRCGDRSFLHMAGAGLDSRFFERTDPALKRRVGWLAYLPAAALALRTPPSRFTVVADGWTTTVVSHLVLIANGGSIINPKLRLLPAVRADDGWLDVLIFTATGHRPIAQTLGRLASRTLRHSPFIVSIPARHVALDADPALAVQLDGDVVSRTPVTFEIEPAALNVVTPSRHR